MNIDRLQAYIRGWNARNEVFFPQQILPFVQEHFATYERIDYLDLARLICCEINQISVNPRKFEGRCIQLNPSVKYPFLKPGECLRYLTRPFHLFIELNDDGKNIELLAAPDDLLGKGSFKLIFGAQNMTMPREFKEDQRIVKHTLNVLAVPNIEKIEVFHKGNRMHKEILENVQGKFVELHVPLKPSSESSTEYYKQIWYNSDLSQASIKEFVPLNFFPHPEHVAFTIKDKLNVFADVAKSLQAMHEKGYIHCDIKPNNLFIKLNPDQKPEGYIGDFDLSQKIGMSEIKGVFGDCLSANELIFPTTDILRLMFALGECFLLADHHFAFQINPLLSIHLNRAATKHCYEWVNSKDGFPYKMYKQYFSVELDEDTNVIVPCRSPQELYRLFGLGLDGELGEPLNRLKIEIMVISEIFDLIQLVFNIHVALDRSKVDEIKEDVKQLKDTTEKIKYFKSKIVPMLYDPAKVCATIQQLATELN